MKLLDPVTIPQDTMGNPQAFAISLPTDQRPASVKLSNQSPWALGVRMSGLADWLDAYTAEVYPVPGDAFEVDFAPRSLFTPQPMVLSAAVLPVLAYAGESFSGTYPMALPRQTSSFSPQTRLSLLAAPILAVTSGPLVPVPLGIQSIGFVVESGAPRNVTIQGSPTGKFYFNETNPGLGISGLGPFITPFDATEDTSVQVTVDTTSGGGPATVAVIGYADLFSFRPRGTDLTNLNRPPDWQLIDTARVLTVPASIGHTIVVKEALFTILCTGVSQQFEIRIWDGDSGTGTKKWYSRVGVQTAGNAPDSKKARGTFNTLGGHMTMDYDAAPLGGNFAFISASGWYV